MTTIKEQFEQIQDPELKELCLRNMNPKWENNSAANLYEAVLGGIEWNTAEGGFDHWKYILGEIKADRVSEIDPSLPEKEEIKLIFGIVTSAGSKQMTPVQQAERKARNRAKFKTDGLAQIEQRDTDAFRHHKNKLGYKS